MYLTKKAQISYINHTLAKSNYGIGLPKNIGDTVRLLKRAFLYRQTLYGGLYGVASATPFPMLR